ncbi:bifunctional transcriptional activator/DNA repair enzyme AdaA [Pseudogracilibacillus auburnensis]|uniref:AraC family transcriptional regulator of adaptative response / methylphosphotriester-DNA alkyltransferase methyltransferase n=1 Tax=Pseudogracilibacillus auburnensis TaxID=1494959 RepID=A0A2V3WEN6_9BACI|nr:Ada metal-binding domain-containing protein [Pseudogracilibacillus auburnensis]PXW90685.1 AraC family transcriptional regulator of adaptative response / methylphosphotriester-DNA alkyltransferase methyltransferase [Pseudogracilibacillus auburnensis]
MKILNNMSKEIMWEAVVTCDPKYDGEFLYAIKTTGIFCRPSCRSKIPKYKNVSFYTNAEEAQLAGYRPCKRCRPDLSLKNYDPLHSIIKDTKEIIENQYWKNIHLNDIAAKVGVSQFHLTRTFKNRTGYTPRLYLEKIRIRKAQELLMTTTLSSTEIGFQIGYQSMSSFYHAFKRHTGHSPRQFQADIKNNLKP